MSGAQIREVAAVLGEPQRGEALAAEIDRRLARIAVDPSRPPLRAIILRPNGFTVGPGSLVDEILRRAGMTNLAAPLDIGAYQQIPLERLAMLDADVLIVDSESFEAPSLATEALSHPIVAELSHRMKVVSLPSRLWTCAEPALVDAVQRLVEATAEARSRGEAQLSGALASTLRAQAAYWPLVAALGGLALVATLASLVVGYVHLDVLAALSDVAHGRASLPALVLVELRLPRAALGCAVGFSLGLTGAAMQGLLRNPLADPGVVGVSGGAALGAVVVFYSGLAGAFSLALPLGGIAGAIVAALALYGLAGRGAGTMTLILAGVTINSFAGALTALALNLSPNPYAAFEIMFWLMGSLTDRSLPQVWLALPLMLAGWALLLSSAPALDALSLGEDTASSLGFDLARLRLTLVAGSALAVGSAVAVTGAIGFVGLVVPHVLRPLVGHRPGRLLLVSGFGGAIVLLGADIGVRLLPIHPELKLGVVTALVGAPFLFGLIDRLRREA